MLTRSKIQLGKKTQNGSEKINLKKIINSVCSQGGNSKKRPKEGSV